MIVNFWNDFGGNAATLFDQDAVPLVARAFSIWMSPPASPPGSAPFSLSLSMPPTSFVNNEAGDRRDGIKGVGGLRLQW